MSNFQCSEPIDLPPKVSKYLLIEPNAMAHLEYMIKEKKNVDHIHLKRVISIYTWIIRIKLRS